MPDGDIIVSLPVFCFPWLLAQKAAFTSREFIPGNHDW